MRTGIVATAVGLSLVSLANANNASALVRKPTQIPPEPLGSALTTLAIEFNLQVLYHTELIAHARSQGANGLMTPDLAFRRVLSGTGFTYRYLDERTVTVLPASSSSGDRPASTSSGHRSRIPRPAKGQRRGRATLPAGFEWLKWLRQRLRAVLPSISRKSQ